MSEYIITAAGKKKDLAQSLGLTEIVRCRDCKGKDYCEAYQDYKNPLGFCAWGEKVSE